MANKKDTQVPSSEVVATSEQVTTPAQQSTTIKVKLNFPHSNFELGPFKFDNFILSIDVVGLDLDTKQRLEYGVNLGLFEIIVSA
jgi:hypothetical protein